MMIFKDTLVVVSESFRVSHSNKERIVDSPIVKVLALVVTYGCEISQSMHARKPAMTLRSLK